MDNEQFKKEAIASLNAVRSKVSADNIALDLYQLYGMKGNIQTYQRRIRSCFDIERPEFFSFADVTNMMLMYGEHEPFFFLCKALGYEAPRQSNPAAQIMALRREIAEDELGIIKKREQLNQLESGESKITQMAVARFSI